MESVNMKMLDKVLVEEPRPAKRREPFWEVTRMQPLRPRYNRTQLALKALLHVYDGAVLNRPTAIWRGGDGLYHKLPSTNMKTFKEALAWLNDKGVIRLYLDGHGHAYADMTPKGLRLMQEPGGGRTLAALFS